MANTQTLDEMEIESSAHLKDRASDMASQAKKQFQEFGRSAADKIDRKRESAADALTNAAWKMHETADSGTRRVSQAIHSAAGSFESTATYLREHDTKRMIRDVADLVKKHPGQSILVGVILGFLAGRAFRND